MPPYSTSEPDFIADTQGNVQDNRTSKSKSWELRKTACVQEATCWQERLERGLKALGGALVMFGLCIVIAHRLGLFPAFLFLGPMLMGIGVILLFADQWF